MEGWDWSKLRIFKILVSWIILKCWSWFKILKKLNSQIFHRVEKPFSTFVVAGHEESKVYCVFYELLNCTWDWTADIYMTSSDSFPAKAKLGCYFQFFEIQQQVSGVQIIRQLNVIIRKTKPKTIFLCAANKELHSHNKGCWTPCFSRDKSMHYSVSSKWLS